MEPDEAVDALRDLDDTERGELLEAMPERTAHELDALLHYPEGQAGGLMTSRMVLAHPSEPVGSVRERLRGQVDHREELDAVLVVDDDGRLLDNVLLLAVPDQRMSALVGEPRPVVAVQTPLKELVERFVESRAHSLVVVDDDGRPVGRVLADDLVDALAEAIGVERSVSRRFSEAPFFLGMFTGLVFLGAAIALAPGNLIALLINTQVVNGLITRSS